MRDGEIAVVPAASRAATARPSPTHPESATVPGTGLAGARPAAYHAEGPGAVAGGRSTEQSTIVSQTPPSSPPPARRGFNWVSALFAVIAVALFAMAIVIAWPLFTGGNQAPRPEAEAGKLQAVHITDALVGQGLDVVQGQGFIPVGVFSVPGQGTTVDGAPLYYFIFPDAEQAAAELAVADAAELGPRGTPVAGSVPDVFHHGNVIVALFDATGDIRAKVEQALAGMP